MMRMQSPSISMCTMNSTAAQIEADHRVARFVVARCIGQHEQRIGENGRCILKRTP
jgi:hypothetical protein